jgi:hypothetical protein
VIGLPKGVSIHPGDLLSISPHPVEAPKAPGFDNGYRNDMNAFEDTLLE